MCLWWMLLPWFVVDCRGLLLLGVGVGVPTSAARVLLRLELRYGATCYS